MANKKLYRIELGQDGLGFCRKQSDNHLENLSCIMVKGFMGLMPFAPSHLLNGRNFFWFTEKGFEFFGKGIMQIAIMNGAIFNKDVILKTKEIDNDYNVIFDDGIQVAIETNK